ncbi:response regulator transcription factor [Aeromonas salmonicida]|uniref:response regulator transcription factor n=1 Tax=Aeromonas salmonicida TaxID=645 RepID=UPI001BA5793E|nr:response regulator transcription factor [Aeromonas salmonicida]MBS2784183.1 response regulator transcription factor [Aeromonas salmonicida]
MSFKIILADDHPLILTGIRTIIKNNHPNCQIVAEAQQVSELLRALQQHPCDLLITDLNMPEDIHYDGLIMIQRLKRDYPALPIIVLTQVHNAGILHSLIKLGVSGLLIKKTVISELSDTINKIISGKNYISNSVKNLMAEVNLDHHINPAQLTPKETEVLRLLASGMSVTQVSEYLHRSVKTISTQKRGAMKKLGITSDSELYEYAKTYGIC